MTAPPRRPRLVVVSGATATGKTALAVDLAGQTLNKHHQYPDGAVLYTGTLFAPIDDRDAPGKGFTHKVGDIVTISTPALGTLVNRVNTSDRVPPWTYGVAALMRDLARRQLL